MSSAFLAPVASASMRIRGVDVPHDIVTHILCAAPDFATLHAAVGVCTTWQTVFVAHRKSVPLAVARNVVGPALVQAVRFVRYPYPEKEPNEWPDADDEEAEEEDDDSATEPDSDGEDSDKLKNLKKKAGNPVKCTEQDDIGMLSPQERVQLQKSASVVNKLEAAFLAKRDVSELTDNQARRFSRAMYRAMLYCELFYLPLNLDDIDSMEDEPGVLDKIYGARRAHLDEYTTQDLLELRAVVAFLHELIKGFLARDDFERLKDVCLATGPAVILRAHKSRSSDPCEEALELEVFTTSEDNALFGGFLSTPLAAILAERQALLPASVWDAIMDEPQPTIDAACAQCAVVGVLWNKSNWKRLINVDLSALLRGKLDQNDHEAEALLGLLMSCSPSGLSTCGTDVVLAEIYDLRTPEFVAWDADDSLCTACLHKLVSAHLHLWLFQRKVAGGWTPTPNCWYGWDCNTQVHKREHARTKNHLCAPVR